MMLRRTFKYRLYPTGNQIRVLDHDLDVCRFIYNSALEQRIDAWRRCGKSLSYNDQQAELTACRAEIPEVGSLRCSMEQDVLRRLDKSYRAFFRRVKRGENPGFPRFKGRNRYDSFTYPLKGFGVKDGRLALAGVGHIKIRLSRPLEGKVKTCSIKRQAGRWYVCFAVEIEVAVIPRDLVRQVGVDVGLKSFATLTDGKIIENPRYLRKAEKKLKKEQRRLSRRVKGSANRGKQKTIVAQIHQKVSDQRNDFHHQESRKLVNNYDLIRFEDLRIKNMVRNHHLAKSISDAGWGQFTNFTSYKAENAGGVVEFVRAPGTSMECHVCGYVNHGLKLCDRHWVCPICVTHHDRDGNASWNILNSKHTVRSTGIDARGDYRQLGGSLSRESALALPSA